jgi:acetyl-CoA carboxylase alpha subunit
MMENAIYSVISPEGCASILWRDSAKAPQAAEALRLTAPDLLDLGIIDEIVREPVGGAHRDPAGAAAILKERILAALSELLPMPKDELLRQRRAKFANMGKFIEG